MVEQPHHHEQEGDDDHQRHQCRLLPRDQHPVVDLKHEERSGQHQQVHEHAAPPRRTVAGSRREPSQAPPPRASRGLPDRLSGLPRRQLVRGASGTSASYGRSRAAPPGACPLTNAPASMPSRAVIIRLGCGWEITCHLHSRSASGLTLPHDVRVAAAPAPSKRLPVAHVDHGRSFRKCHAPKGCSGTRTRWLCTGSAGRRADSAGTARALAPGSHARVRRRLVLFTQPAANSISTKRRALPDRTGPGAQRCRALPSFNSTNPYRDTVSRVRDRFDLLRPASPASSMTETGFSPLKTGAFRGMCKQLGIDPSDL